MKKSKKIVLAVVCLAIVGVMIFAAVGKGSLATVKCTDCGGTGIVETVNEDTGVAEEADCETCGGVGQVRASFWALVPPIIAIGLALITKEVYSSLVIGVIAGALIHSNFSFTGMMDSMVNDGFITAVKDTAGAMLSTFALGVLIFIDDYFNCLTVGSVMRPVTDGHKISRAKLSYLIDATAAPVCMIAPISSWAAAVASYASDGNGLSLFVKAIPYNFYSLLTLVFIVAISVMKFDYGPMRIHEINAKHNGDLYTSGDKNEVPDEDHSSKGKVIDLVLPIIVLIGVCVFALVYNGGILDGISFINAFSNTDATVGLPWGSLIALVFAIIYLCARKVVSFKEAMECIPKGFIAMVPAILILTLATSLKNMTGALGAKYYVADVMDGAASSLDLLLPAIIFLVACGLSFAIGTSWGTFGILIPIVVAIFPAGTAIQTIGMSACLAGAVCGDHCSPISDTTIMSSAGGQCNHINHVSTQLPYAISVAAISFIMYIISGFIQKAYIVPAVADENPEQVKPVVIVSVVPLL